MTSSHVSAVLSRIDFVIKDLTSLKLELQNADQMDIMGDGVKPVTHHQVIVSNKDIVYARTLEEFKSLNALLGGKIRNQDTWDTWTAIIIEWGWNNVIKATERIEPMKRWPNVIQQALWDAKKAKTSRYDTGIAVKPKIVLTQKQKQDNIRIINKIRGSR